MIKINIYKNKKGFSLVEVLIAMAIFSMVIISSISLMVGAARDSVNNDIRSNAENMGVRVLEFLKAPDGNITDCSGNPLTIETNAKYSVGVLDPSAAERELCLSKFQTDSSELTFCIENERYYVDLSEFTTNDFSEVVDVICVQVSFEDLPDSELEQIHVRVVYDGLASRPGQPDEDQNIIIDFFGLNRDII